jgi:peptide/nickel transport system permease protein
MGKTIRRKLTAPAAPEPEQKVRSFLRTLYRRPESGFGTSVVLLFLFLAVTGPLFVPYGSNEQVYEDARQSPSPTHLFGTDHLGRDVFSRIVLGTRSILVIAGGGTLVAVALGTLIGLASGYRGGWIDEIVMRFFDSLLSLPALLIALLLLGTMRSALGESVPAVGRGLGVLLILTVVYTPIVARVVRSVVLSVKTKGFIEAARTQGESRSRVLFKEILPSVLPALAVEAALRFSYAIFLTASLGFLGVGVQPPNPDWGLMVAEGRAKYSQVPWAMYFPAIAISLLVIGVNLMADGIKRAIQRER